MRFVEVSGKTKDEAITNAIVELGVPEEQVDIEVLSEGKGIFGLFGKNVKIRATLKEEAEIQTEKKPEKKAKAKPEATSESVKPAEKTENKKENKKEAKPAKKEEKQPEEKVQEETHTIEVEGLTVTGEKVIINDTIEQRLRKANASKKAEERSGEGHKKSDRQDRRPRSRKPLDEDVQTEEETAEAKPVYEPKVFEIPEDADEVMTKTCSFVTELLSAMGIASTVTAKFSEDGIMEVDIAGEGMGLIIGKRGATLDSLQYLATLVINKDRKDHVRLKLDTEGYRARRQETLEKLAINMAKKAKRTGHRVVLEPMNPYERRIIHSALQNESGVETHSDGEEPYRKVIISPKRRH